MTTAITKAKPAVQLPAAMLEELNREALDIKERIGTPSGDLITCTRNKTFKLPGLDVEAPELRAIIVDWVAYNQFYQGKYDPNNIKPPVCMSIAVKDKEAVPFANSPKKQHEDCFTCPQNKFDPNGGGKPCKNQRLLALLNPDDQDGPLMLLKVSPTGIRYFDKYVTTVTNAGHAVPHPMAVVTLLTFDPKPEYASLRFAPAEPNSHVEAAFRRRKEARERLLTPPVFSTPVAA